MIMFFFVCFVLLNVLFMVENILKNGSEVEK